MIKDEKLQFLAYQKPALENGSYRIELKQTVKPNSRITADSFEKSLDFVVLGERFRLPPEAVHAMFPPAGSYGRYSNCLPHISINQSTFCWQRSAYGDEDFEPWVALLLFDEQEFEDGLVKHSTITLGDLNKSLNISLEISQQLDDKVNVIDVDPSLLRKLIPNGAELKTLAHVRKKVSDKKTEQLSVDELAVVISNRLPKAGSSSVVHLVSVEGRFNQGKVFSGLDTAKTPIRLVSLANWGFTCPAQDGENFETLVENINTGLIVPTTKVSTDATNAVFQTVKSLQVNGYVPFPHQLRQTDTTYSWYRGPLAPAPVAREFLSEHDLPHYADALTRYYEDIGMFDVSYSAAFELGRALALEDEIFSADIYRWKNQYNERVCLELQQLEIQALTGATAAEPVDEVLTNKIKNWLTQLAYLVDVPFNYLVPDSHLLAPHSLKCFQLDQHWLESLLYGALSVGGVVREKDENDGSRLQVFNDFTSELLANPKSGFLLRSELVSDYPDLHIAAYSIVLDNTDTLSDETLGAQLTLHRKQKLGPEVILCIFDGEVSTIELYLKPEGLHYGLDEELENSGQWQQKKQLSTEYIFNAVKNHLPQDIAITTELTAIKRDIAEKKLFYQPNLDNPSADGGQFEFQVNFRSDAQAQRVINISEVSTSLSQILCTMTNVMTGLSDSEIPAMIKHPSSAQFGMNMLEGSNKGRFVKTPKGAQA